MLKVVIQAIPTYTMSCFEIPVVVCESQRKAIANFWWGTEGGRKKMHWRSWEWFSTPKSLGGMGFRDLTLFNQAMLGRQCWRLLTDPSSLCARVLKGRYFPDGDFWDAPQPRASSYTWRSICFGMKLVKEGILWKVGNGRKIKMLTDNWIPNFKPGSFRLLAPVPAGATVDFLLSDDDHCSWNTDTVHSIFEEEVANQILQIPISRRVSEDFMSWPFTRFGEYSVASAYNLARTEKFYMDRSKQGGGSSSTTADECVFWKKLWAIKAPGKMKTNLWRMAHDCLPSEVQLCKRHITTSAACTYCNRDESIEHAVLFCPFACEVWREIKLVYNLHLLRRFFTCPKAWLYDFMLNSTDKEKMILTVTVWHIWTTRNAVRNGETMRSPHSVAEQVKAYAEMIELHLFKPATSTRRDTNPSSQSWCPLPEGTVHINVDAAIFSSSCKMGVGVVIRGHNGACLAACSELIDMVTAPETAEALAMRRALFLAREEGFRKLMVVSDCLSVIQRVKHSSVDRGPAGVVIQDIKHLATQFDEISFSHVYRQFNVAAHTLARSAEHFLSTVFRNFAPECIRQTLCYDL